MNTNQATAKSIHQDSLVMITHDHRPVGPDLSLMRDGGVTAKVYQVTLDVDPEAGAQASRHRTENWLHLAVTEMERVLREIEAHAEDCFLARTADDVRRAKAEDRIAILLGAEGARWLESSLEPLRLFHRLGLRELQLTWAFANPLVPDGRLSEFGHDVVRECERLGVIVDVTHIPPDAFFQVMDLAQKPVIVSHGTAASVTVDLPDEKLQALAATGGLIGIHFYTSYLGPTPTPEGVVDQIDYIAELVGIDHVALGVDFFPTEGVWYQLQVDQGTTNLVWAVDDMSGMPRITESLVERGYSEEDIRKVLGLNFLRVCEEVFVPGS